MIKTHEVLTISFYFTFEFLKFLFWNKKLYLKFTYFNYCGKFKLLNLQTKIKQQHKSEERDEKRILWLFLQFKTSEIYLDSFEMFISLTYFRQFFKDVNVLFNLFIFKYFFYCQQKVVEIVSFKQGWKIISCSKQKSGIIVN